MPKKVTITIRLDEDLYKEAKQKADRVLYMPLATLIRVFLKVFISQEGIGFFVGDHNLKKLINNWIRHRNLERFRQRRDTVHPSRLKDIFDLNA
jgi:antitoxin component of RelBE/YafQ-DinJ toxin-antitoxin module